MTILHLQSIWSVTAAQPSFWGAKAATDNVEIDLNGCVPAKVHTTGGGLNLAHGPSLAPQTHGFNSCPWARPTLQIFCPFKQELKLVASTENQGDFYIKSKLAVFLKEVAMLKSHLLLGTTGRS